MWIGNRAGSSSGGQAEHLEVSVLAACRLKTAIQMESCPRYALLEEAFEHC